MEVLHTALKSQSDNPLDKAKQKLSGYVAWFESRTAKAKAGVVETEEAYSDLVRYLAVDVASEETKDVLALLITFLADFSKEVGRLAVEAKRPLKAGELQVKMRMKRAGRHSTIA
jgi:hypothetical protein